MYSCNSDNRRLLAAIASLGGMSKASLGVLSSAVSAHAFIGESGLVSLQWSAPGLMDGLGL